MHKNLALEFQAISKSFGDRIVNDRISFAVPAGTIHAIVGENGAGKSTLMNVLFGIHQPDSGQIAIQGQVANILSPIDARELRIGMVHQHFLQALQMTALEHVALDQYAHLDASHWARTLDRISMMQKLTELSRQFQMPVNWDQLVERMGVGEQQRIEILKLLFFESDILILDEPTSVLTPQETIAFLEQLRGLRDKGKTILLITHKLKEVMAVADHVTVLRKGRTISTKPIQDCTLESIAADMIGSISKSEKIVRGSSDKNGIGCKWTRFTNSRLKNIDLGIHYGEILGVVGVEGNGQSDLIRSIIDTALGSNSDFYFSGGLALSAQRIAYLPENRIEQGLIPSGSALENFLLGQDSAPKFKKFFWINYSKLRSVAQTFMHEFHVEPNDLELPMHHFSGGNQQKLVVARELSKTPDFIVAAHPTRGVDIGASELIHKKLMECRNTGAAVMLVSSDLDECLALSDRIAVIYEGRIQCILDRDQFDETLIGQKMTGANT